MNKYKKNIVLYIYIDSIKINKNQKMIVKFHKKTERIKGLSFHPK